MKPRQRIPMMPAIMVVRDYHVRETNEEVET
jgi:hypothetical protein